MSEFKSNMTKTLYLKNISINLSRKRKLGITYNQYIICAVIDAFIEKHQIMYNTDMKEMADIFQISDLRTEILELKSKKIISVLKNSTGIFVQLTDKWSGIPSDYISKFELLWNDYGKVGNRSQSLKMFIRFLKSGETWDNLWGIYWPSYKKYLELSKVSQQYLSTFLNPEEERYLQVYVSNAHYKEKPKNADIVAVNQNIKRDPKDAR